MSFLNPVSEPVKRFSSTDAGAPQINYNARVAGDVKTVLKACLVVGYGDKASAGWSIANEVDHVAEFVSPSAAMSDYRLGIDDSTATKTDWFYQYKNARKNPKSNAPVKAFVRADKVSANNGWQLLVSERGLLFIEIVQHTTVSSLSCRLTYFSAQKSTSSTIGDDIVFFNTGHSGAINTYNQLYGYANAYISQDATAKIITTSPHMLGVDYTYDASSIDLAADIYTALGNGSALLGKLPALMCQTPAQQPTFGLRDVLIDGRAFLEFFCGDTSASATTVYGYGRTFLSPLDYWEY
ncbi:hypothetical protein [Psychrobacter pacificensis]|uniref:hypothetical protein n=1 Tax=Psychrobacter pacificensis TaxID=112002 RepID=UPI001CC07045|nr:hypothetical protein [Psychrobacter pacificensis]MBZ1392846.1 hypothetical protein [Psychrobacter pacificensis]